MRLQVLLIISKLVIDIKQKKFLEKRDVNEVLVETFGEPFGFHWFVPIKIGGYKPFFKKLQEHYD